MKLAKKKIKETRKNQRFLGHRKFKEFSREIKLYCPECGCEVEAVKGKLVSCCGTEMKGKDKCSCC